MKHLLQLRLLVVACLALCGWHASRAQTPGIIFRPAATPAGRLVLDPNGNGYSSIADSGFATNDLTESEIPYRAVPLINQEPMGDLRRGPDGRFSDIAFDSNNTGVYTYLDAASNFLFRFRIGNTMPGSKGYSVLIDTDNKMGNVPPNADPDYQAGTNGIDGNPGFEIEIVLETNFQVAVYDVRGTSNPVLIFASNTYPFTDFSQYSVALTTRDGTPDYYYDFYIPFSVLQSYFGITVNTPLRIGATTVMAPKAAIGGPKSDIYGQNGSYGGNFNQAWTDFIRQQPSVSPNGLNTTGFPGPCTATPVISSSLIMPVTSISGTVAEAAGATINLYKGVNSTTVVGTATSTGGNPSSWTVSSFISYTPAIGDTIVARTVVAAKTTCMSSSPKLIAGVCSAAPIVTTNGTANSRKGICGTALANNATLRLYLIPSVGAAPVLQQTSPVAGPPIFFGYSQIITSPYDWSYGCNAAGGNSTCGQGGPCMPGTALSYLITVTAPGECESAPAFSCNGGSNSPAQTAAPVITTGSPIAVAATTIAGTSVSGAVVYLFQNGYQIGQTTAVGTAWSIASSSFSSPLVSGATIVARAQLANECVSNASISATVASCVTATPVIASPIFSTATSISGTSSEIGATVTVQKNTVTIGTATVAANGTWSITSITVATSDAITATQTRAPCTVSGTASVTVQAVILPPVITGPNYVENSAVINGTFQLSMPLGTVVYLYMDGSPIDTVTTTSAGTTWQANSYNTREIYVDGILSATIRISAGVETALSNLVPVICATPSFTNTLAVTDPTIIVTVNTTGSAQVTGAQTGLAYTLWDNVANKAIGPSRMGANATLTLPTFRLTPTPITYTYTDVRVKVDKIGTSCGGFLTEATVFQVPDQEATYTVVAAKVYNTYTNGFSLATVADPDGTVSTAVINTGTLPPGVAFNTTTGQFTASNAALITPGITIFTVRTTDVFGGTTDHTVTLTFLPDNDKDGIADTIDLDDDNDGIPDTAESGGTDATGDADIDGILNYKDPSFCTLNGASVCASLDKDGDGVIDQFDLDADNDGIPDLVEAGGVDNNGDGRVDALQTNNTGTFTPGQDADNDGWVDIFDNVGGSVTSGSPLPNADKDGDGVKDYLDLDTDNDGITDIVEAGGSDSNGDGKVDTYTDADLDGFTDTYDPDDDGTFGPDGGAENNAPLVKTGTDIGGDGKADDGEAITQGDGTTAQDTDGDGKADWLDLDSDNDGITDIVEAGGADSDGDGRVDGYTDGTDGDGYASVNDPDDNNDGTMETATSPLVRTNGDTGTDGKVNGTDFYAEGNGTTSQDTDGDGIADFLDLDSDNDGIADLVETGGSDSDGDGKADIATDADNDGYADIYDSDDDGAAGIEDATDPLVTTGTDANADGKISGAETYLSGDLDGDGKLNAADLDSDSDGITDAMEAENGAMPSGYSAQGKISVMDDADNNGWSDARQGAANGFLIPDTDANSNGKADEGYRGTGDDFDSDKRPNAYDIDSDNDGIIDADEAQPSVAGALPLGTDTDGDGIDNAFDPDNGGTAVSSPNNNDAAADGVDYLDPDADNDGSRDWVEGFDGPDANTDALTELKGKVTDWRTASCGVNPACALYNNATDADGDGYPAYVDINDGVVNANAGPNYLPPFLNPASAFWSDQNNNGLADLFDGVYGGEQSREPQAGVASQSAAAPGGAATTPDYRSPSTVVTFPVEWLFFTGTQEGANVRLAWATASEQNSDHYALERSADGLAYSPVTSKKAAGTSLVRTDYDYVDADAALLPTSTLFYRLRQFDVDGNEGVSLKAEIALNNNGLDMSVYPNPATSTLYVRLGAGDATRAELRIVNVLGQTVLARSLDAADLAKPIACDLTSLAKGVYHVEVAIDKTKLSRRVVVE